MKCNLCKKECMESELVNGVCYGCLGKLNEIVTNTKKKGIIDKYNILSDIVLAIGILSGIVCGIGIFNLVKEVFDSFITILLSILGAGLIIISAWYKSLILEGEAEKIKLLEEIKKK